MIGRRLLMLGASVLMLSALTATNALAKSDRTLEAQQILTKLGHYKGDLDGSWGQQSREALNAFQKQAGFKTSSRLTRGFRDVLKTIDQGGTRNYVPIEERIGNTLIVNTGERIYFNPNSTKVIQLKNGKKYKRKWRQMDNGLYCETLFNKKEFCEGVSSSNFVIFKIKDETRWYQLNGRLKWTMKLKEGNQLK